MSAPDWYYEKREEWEIENNRDFDSLTDDEQSELIYEWGADDTSDKIDHMKEWARDRNIWI